MTLISKEIIILGQTAFVRTEESQGAQNFPGGMESEVRQSRTSTLLTDEPERRLNWSKITQ